jgi:hypothetical protein
MPLQSKPILYRTKIAFMKKHLVLITATILFSLAFTFFSNEGIIYLATALMATVVILALRNSGPRMMKFTRWAKANPRITQVWITVLLVFLLSLGMVVGYDLMQLGYKFSDATAVVFSVVMIIGFFSVPLFPKKNTITLPFTLNRYRVLYTAILIAAYALAVISGNRVEDKYPNSILANVLASIDQKLFSPGDSNLDDEQFLLSDPGNPATGSEAAVFAAFPSTETPSTEPTLSKKEAKAKLKALKKAEKLEKKQKRMMKRMEKWRKVFAAGASGGSVLLIILLVLGTCTGICLIIGGFSGGGAWAVILGVAVATASIYGIVKVSKSRREQREKILKEESKQ